MELELTNPTAPHRTIITIMTETHELMPNGECRGVPVHKARKVYLLDGQDKYITIRQTNELLDEVGSKCHTKKT